ILALGIAVDQIILLVRSRDVPHLPLAIVVHEVGLVYAPVLPLFSRNEHRFGWVPPFVSVPLLRTRWCTAPKNCSPHRHSRCAPPISLRRDPSPLYRM